MNVFGCTSVVAEYVPAATKQVLRNTIAETTTRLPRRKTADVMTWLFTGNVTCHQLEEIGPIEKGESYIYCVIDWCQIYLCKNTTDTQIVFIIHYS